MPPTPLLLSKVGTLTASGVQSKSVAELGAVDVSGRGCAATLGDTPPVDGAPDGAGCLAVLKEDGVTRAAEAQYGRDGKATVLSLSVYALQFGDATGAYSAYTFLRSQLKAAKVTAGDARLGKASETTTDAAGALAWAGTSVIRVEGKPSAQELTSLISALPKVGGRAGLAPLLPTYLPSTGLQPGTERYALGPVGYGAMGGKVPNDLIDWSKSTEVLTAAYEAHGQGQLTLLLYPTPQIAGDRGRALEKYVNGVGEAQLQSQFGTLKMRRVGPLLGMTTGALDAQAAAGLMGALHLSQEVSFDQKMPLEFHAEVQKTYTLLQSIAIFTGVAVLAAVLLALFLGGARAGIRVLQGKPAASEPEFLTINLRDEPKALFAGKRTDGE